MFANKNKIRTKMAPLWGASFYIISTKFGRKHLWGMGIKFCENKGAGPKRGKM